MGSNAPVANVGGERLDLVGGERLLDVGCGLGEAALALADDLGVDGDVVGVDISEQMVRVARTCASSARCRVRFTAGDACSLDEPDDSYGAARSERTLQWLTDPTAAMAEMVRVVRPGGRMSLIDTDWSTRTIDVGDNALTEPRAFRGDDPRRSPARSVQCASQAENAGSIPSSALIRA
jgi:ubiquinone/menaquinone biosynthesis C-methylase UbiE